MPPTVGGSGANRSPLALVLVASYVGVLLFVILAHFGPSSVYKLPEKIIKEKEANKKKQHEDMQKQLHFSIRNARDNSEKWLASVRDAQRRLDASQGRVTSTCPAPSRAWLAQDCRPAPTSPTRIVTDHFPKYNDSFLVPHYDELGHWRVSATRSIWEITVAGKDGERRLRCAEAWLNFSQAFRPIGSLDAEAVQALDAKVASLGLKRRIREDPRFQRYLTVVLTRQAAWVEGYHISPTEAAKHMSQVLRGMAGSNLTSFEVGIVRSFGEGQEYANTYLATLKPYDWKFEMINRLHEKICRTENVTSPGHPRHDRQNVEYGLSFPNPLGYEVPHLTRLFIKWLRLVTCPTVAEGVRGCKRAPKEEAPEGQRQCSHPLLVAFDVFVTLYHIHPYLDCNTRVTQTLMNALLVGAGYPPVQLLLFADKKHLRQMQDQAVRGNREPLYKFLLERVQISAELLEQYDLLYGNLLDNSSLSDKGPER